MWLRDRLPHDVPGLRSIIYGYDTSLNKSKSFQTIDDLAMAFVTNLKSIGRAAPSAKRSIILAHSLGGIVLKQALTLLANSDRDSRVLETICQIIFFGTPNKGMNMSHLLSIVEGQPNEPLLKLLSPGSTYLSELDHRFGGISILRQIEILSVFETKTSATTEVIPVP